MAFHFQSMQSFKMRVTLIFFTFILIIIALFIWFSQIEKKLDYFHTIVDELQEIKFNISESTLKLQSSITKKQENLQSFEVENAINSFQSDLNNKREAFKKLKNEFSNYSLGFTDELDKIIHNLTVVQESVSDERFEPIQNMDLVVDKQMALNTELDVLVLKINQLSDAKNKALHDNVLLLLVLIAVLILGSVYYLANKMTRDLNRLKLKITTPKEYNEKALISNIDDVKNLDKAFESLNVRLKKLEMDLEEAIKISEYKSVFLSNMSYEIRTPLNSALGMINMLKQSQLTTEQQIQLEIAEYSSEHVLQLVNMIHDNSKIEEGGKVELELKSFDLKSDLSKLVKVFEYDAWEKGLEFEFKFLADKNQKFLLLGDIKKIKQILTNLLSNAIKFTNSGKVSLIIDQTVGPDDYQIVTFYIKDTGIGIDPEKARRIFSDFEKNHLSIMDYYGGTGLGLIASSQLINLMGGELKLESKENEGSIFYFSIQLQKTLNVEREQLEPTPVLLNQFDYRYTVLVAEDNKMNQKVIKFLLEQQGADCTFVKNGSDAVKLFNILDFDMVFMDIFMPEMDGYEATKLIKSSKKYASHKVPVIAVSASAFEDDIENAKKAGIDDFLAKPIESERLKELLIKYAPKNNAV